MWGIVHWLFQIYLSYGLVLAGVTQVVLALKLDTVLNPIVLFCLTVED